MSAETVAERAELVDALRAAVELIDQILPYVAIYFVRKWDFDKERDEIKSVLDRQGRRVGEHSE